MNIIIFLRQMLSTGFGTMEIHDLSRQAQTIDAGEMTLDTFLRHLWETDFHTMLENLLKAAGLTAVSAIALPLVILLGLLWCFFGLKLIRIWAAFMGMAIGLLAGIWDAEVFRLPPVTGWVLGIILGVLLALVAVKFYQAGIFLATWFAGSFFAALILHPEDWIRILICIGIGLVIGLIALHFAEISSIIITAVGGALSTGAGICAVLALTGQSFQIGMTIVLAVAGVTVQYLMEYNKRKKSIQESVDIPAESPLPKQPMESPRSQ